MSTDRSPESVEREAALRRRPAGPQAGEATHADPPPHPLVALGRQVGNAQVARMLAQREGPDEEEEAPMAQARHDAAAQREGEEDEEEAPAAMARHDPAAAQRDDAEAEGEEMLQAKPEVGLEGGPLSAGLSGRIDSRRGAGAPLDGGTRAHMEGAFGASFADVRVHTDSESDALNRSISAKAFTTGSDIFFRRDTSPGDHSLLAHELTHVVQQRSMSGGGPLSVGPAGDHHEQEADAAATAVTSGAAPPAQAKADAAQRTEEDEEQPAAMAQHDRAAAQREGEEDEEEAPMAQAQHDAQRDEADEEEPA